MSKNKKFIKDDEIKELIKKSNLGDKVAEEKIIENYKWLIVKIARKYMYISEIDDLIQEGNIGLIKAIRNFDENKETKFITYATLLIKSFILNYINRKDLKNTISLEQEFDNVELGDIIIDEEAESKFYKLLDGKLSKYLEDIIDNTLTEKEATVIKLKYGLGKVNCCNLKDLGIKMYLSETRIRQIEMKALRKLRLYSEKNNKGKINLKECLNYV